ncbi:hypothetical protein CYLTODRAFT_82882 [Cylindrobasidium torrendii FP15055 ss-10]|uniref:Nephrocystin 3-like N-terminal domain-containing protein n=1 Tax=Cylindrobasidium torrendii FP15055 ss-10 TaxID=1314674 RepID=A0A0D7B3U0_9AGAR|nr:hypothetical protein CYLTODRAFT_82882 [Cylindrobasidium torrendii FP15055 ss-10]
MNYLKKAKQRRREKKGKGPGKAENLPEQEIVAPAMQATSVDTGHSGAVGKGMKSHFKHGGIRTGAMSALIAAGAIAGKPNVGSATNRDASMLEGTSARTTEHNEMNLTLPSAAREGDNIEEGASLPGDTVAGDSSAGVADITTTIGALALDAGTAGTHEPVLSIAAVGDDQGQGMSTVKSSWGEGRLGGGAKAGALLSGGLVSGNPSAKVDVAAASVLTPNTAKHDETALALGIAENDQGDGKSSGGEGRPGGRTKAGATLGGGVTTGNPSAKVADIPASGVPAPNADGTSHNKTVRALTVVEEDQNKVPSATKLFWKKCGARAWSGLKYTMKLGEAVSKGHPAEAAFAGIGFFITFAEDIAKTHRQLASVVEDTFRLIQDLDDELIKKPNQSEGAYNAVDALLKTLNAQKERMERIMDNKLWQQITDKDARADEVQDAMSTIKAAVVRLQYMVLLSIDRTTNDLRSSLAQLLRDVQWPCIDEASFQNSVHTTCTPETRTSAIAQIRDWVDDLRPDCPPIFWLTGPAGMGKSTIMRTVCTTLDGDDPSPLAASFFCSRQIPSRRTLANVVPTLVTMLARESRWFCAALQDAHRTDRVRSHPDRQMEDILFGPWRAAAQRERQVPLVVVVDALDELDGDGGAVFLERLMNGVTKYDLKGIKFLVASREDPGIARLCKTLGPEVVIRLQDIKGTESDIFRFLRTKGPHVSKDLLREVAAQSGNLFVRRKI